MHIKVIRYNIIYKTGFYKYFRRFKCDHFKNIKVIKKKVIITVFGLINCTLLKYLL